MSDFNRVIAYYANLLKENEDPARAVGWKNPSVQTSAFIELCETVGFEAGVSVLDVGCGVGGLYAFLRRQGINVDYTGIDINPAAIDAARSRHPDGRFFVCNLLTQPIDTQYDFVFAHGVLTVAVEEHDTFVRDMIAAMFARCRVATVITALSTYGAPMHLEFQRDHDYQYFTPDELLYLCSRLTPRTVLAQDRFPGSMTVSLFRVHKGSAAAFEAAFEWSAEVWDDRAETLLWYLQRTGDFERARAVCHRLPPGEKQEFHLGQIAMVLGDDEQAKAHFLKCRELRDDDAQAAVALGALAFKAGDLDAARRYFEASLTDANETLDDSRLALARIAIRQDRLADAKDEQSKIEREVIRDELEAELRLAHGNKAGAVALLESIVRRYPQHAGSARRLRRLYVEVGAEDKAEALDLQCRCKGW